MWTYSDHPYFCNCFKPKADILLDAASLSLLARRSMVPLEAMPSAVMSMVTRGGREGEVRRKEGRDAWGRKLCEINGAVGLIGGVVILDHHYQFRV